MTREFQNRAIALGVLGLGLTVWGMAGRSLNRAGEMACAPNVLHLKGSPFGRTIAMAMQGPADVYFHEGQAHDHAPGHKEGCSACEAAKAKQEHLRAAIASTSETGSDDGNDLFVAVGGSEHVHTEACGHDCSSGEPALEATHNHGPGEACATCDHEATLAAAASPDKGIRERILDQIREWRAADNTRTNPYGNSEAHKFFIRREIEKKLFLSYQMDPTNYAGYGAYFLFLNESALGTHTNGKQQARKLAEITAVHCMREQDNPQALLTAAAASHDMISLLVEEDSSEGLGVATQYASVTAHCLNRFEELALQMVFDGTWERFSVARQTEMTERARMLRVLHKADRKILSASVSHAGADGENRKSPTG